MRNTLVVLPLGTPREATSWRPKMKFICTVACLLLACRPVAKHSEKLPGPAVARTVFTDSTIFRAQCKEADSLKTLSPIPLRCTPRDQRVRIY